MSILFSNLIVGLEPVAYSKAVYASIIGSNIGAFLTPLGALAGIMFSGLVQKHGVKLHFLKFCEYGAILAIPTLFSALLILEVIL